MRSNDGWRGGLASNVDRAGMGKRKKRGRVHREGLATVRGSVDSEARDAARSLRQFANRGRVVPEIGDSAIRELFVFKSYRMLYRVLDREVQVLAFIHGSRDLNAALNEPRH